MKEPHNVVIIDSLPDGIEKTTNDARYKHNIGLDLAEVPEVEKPRRETVRRNFGNPYGMMAAAALAASITNPFSSNMFEGHDRPGSLRLPLPPSRKKNRTADPEKKAKRKAQGKARAKNRRK